jgi:purine nucleosidase
MSGPHDRNMVRMRAQRLGRAAAWLLAGTGLVVILVAVLLALPVEQWRTGKRFENTLSTLPEAALPQPAQRIWIDSDPACGVGRRVDADDCLAILYLALHGDIDIVGVSTVFGNASLEVTDGTARELVDVLTRQGMAQLAVHAGASEPRGRKLTTPATEAERALIDALSARPLTILALGPLTNWQRRSWLDRSTTPGGADRRGDGPPAGARVPPVRRQRHWRAVWSRAHRS